MQLVVVMAVRKAVNFREIFLTLHRQKKSVYIG